MAEFKFKVGDEVAIKGAGVSYNCSFNGSTLMSTTDLDGIYGVIIEINVDWNWSAPAYIVQLMGGARAVLCKESLGRIR